MTDRPIIFSAAMVRALLDGRKSQTRRVLKPQPEQNSAGLWVWPSNWRTGIKRFGTCIQGDEEGLVRALMGDPWRRVGYAPGDRLYVREAFSYDRLDVDRDGTLPPWYWADGNPSSGDWSRPKPSIFCPRWASRITLTVTEVRVQRLQEISAGDSIAEGVECDTCTAMGQSACHGRGCFASIDAYRHLWNSLHGPDAWAANPWVVVVSFTTRKGNIDTPSAESASAARGETP